MLKEMSKSINNLSIKFLAEAINIDIEKPLICIVSAYSATSLIHRNVDKICQRIKEGVLANGGEAVIVNIATVDCTAMHNTAYSKMDLPGRDMVASNIELIASSNMYDGYIYVGGDPNTLAGMVLGALKNNTPCMFFTPGIMSPIEDHQGAHGIFGIYSKIAEISAGVISKDMLPSIISNTPLTCGNDCDRYGHNGMACALETMGLTLQGVSTVTAMSAQHMRLAFDTGNAIMLAIDNKMTPRRLLSSTALYNAITMDLSCGGSSTTLLNLLAIAYTLSYKNITLDTIDNLSRSVPLLLNKRQSPLMPIFHKAGGVYALLKQLHDAQLLKNDSYRYDGNTITQCVDDIVVANDNIIRPHYNAVGNSSSLRVLYGNVATEGSICHYYNNVTSFNGHAKIYYDEESLVDAILHREIRAGDVVVVLNQGAKSGIGMPELIMPVMLLNALSLSSNVAIITDGRIPDNYQGMIVGHITPETYHAGLIALLQDGDELEISIPKGKITCNVKAKEVQQRHRNYNSDGATYTNNILNHWAQTLTTPAQGCIRSKR